MKYNTKPIDYKGCHPAVAHHLLKGLAIECWVWDYEEEYRERKLVVAYRPDRGFPYQTISEPHLHAKPVELQLTIKDPVDLMKSLVKGGWKVNRAGAWAKEKHPSLTPMMWKHCCESVLANDYNWDPEWLEEK